MAGSWLRNLAAVTHSGAVGSTRAQTITIRGVVQGVGFRPFVFRIASAHGITGWVLNDSAGVRIHAEGCATELERFVSDLKGLAPPAARIDHFVIDTASVAGYADFSIAATGTIGPSGVHGTTSAFISPDLPVCADCLTELFDAGGRRAGYPYINCTACGPRYSIILGLPYDRHRTTMQSWTMCTTCAGEYEDPSDRRFHAQPTACHECGPQYRLVETAPSESHERFGDAAIAAVANLLCIGKIIAIKGIGGYHFACDATNVEAVEALRTRKYRKERPFAMMVRDISTARQTVRLTLEAESLLTASPRPIVVAAAAMTLAGVAPGINELGVMLPYTPLHHLLFSHGAPSRLVMTSANRSSEPIAYLDEDAVTRLSGIADSFLVGERPIARRVDDSVVKISAAGPMILRRSRGYAPGMVARIPTGRPVLAVGADLKNAITVVVDGNAMMSQHIGDLDDYSSLAAFRETVSDLTGMYEVDADELCIVHDLHPEYSSTLYAVESVCRERRAVQHHRAHVASVLAERGAYDERVIGVAFDGTGYGDDGSTWGGEFFCGSVMEGFKRVGHLRPVRMPGGDAAARYPVQSVAGFLGGPASNIVADLTSAPFHFPTRYVHARSLIERDVRCFTSTSIGRLFDAIAALLGFTRAITYEGQAAVWLEQLAMGSRTSAALPCPFVDHELDFRATVAAVIDARIRGCLVNDIARAFHRGLARGTSDAIRMLSDEHGLSTAVLSGGVFQNDVLLGDILECLASSSISVWLNQQVPPNDGGISLGQAALVLGAAKIPAP